jgi:hypothetical protein
MSTDYTILAFLADAAVALAGGIIVFFFLSGVGIWTSIVLERWRSRD